MNVQAPTAPPGWFPDPANPGGHRWWDGAGWTEHCQPATPPPPAAEQRLTAPAQQAAVAPPQEAAPPPAPRANAASESLFLNYSRDRDAMARYSYWSDTLSSLPFWKGAEKREAKAGMAEARAQCIAAGVDWESAPRPPEALHAPDRSQRPAIGKPRTIAEEMDRVRERVERENPQAFRQAQGNGGGGDVSGAGVATGVGAAASGFLAYHWIAGGQAEAAHVNADGSAWFQDADGGAWFQDVGGDVFAWGGGGFSALGADGFFYAAAADGSFFAYDDAGTPFNVSDDGMLYMDGSDGSMLALGEDGSLYSAGADGSWYTQAADGSFVGAGADGSYFAAPDGSGFSGEELAAIDAGSWDGGGGGDDGGWLDLLSF
jgi:hypothetical protein